MGWTLKIEHLTTGEVMWPTTKMRSSYGLKVRVWVLNPNAAEGWPLKVWKRRQTVEKLKRKCQEAYERFCRTGRTPPKSEQAIQKDLANRRYEIIEVPDSEKT